MFNAIINWLYSAFQAVIDFFVSLWDSFWHFVFDFVEWIFDLFQWVATETLYAVYHYIVDVFNSMGVSFPLSRPSDLLYWYHQINLFFPLSESLTVLLILLNTWAVCAFIRLVVRLKLSFGVKIAKAIFK